MISGYHVTSYHSGLSSKPPFMAASGRLAHMQVWVLLGRIFHQSFVTTVCSWRSALDRAIIYYLASQRHCFPFHKTLSSCCVLHNSFKTSILAWLRILPMERLSSLKLTSARHKFQFHVIQTLLFAEAVHTNPDSVLSIIAIHISTTTLSAGIPSTPVVRQHNAELIIQSVHFYRNCTVKDL